MKSKLILLFGIATIVVSCNKSADNFISSIDPGSYDGTWWNRTPIRLLQTNFPEVYASMSVDDYVQSMIDASATAVLFNTGGITASYQTKLPYQCKNPHMGDKDFVGELIEKLHAKGIKYIARFDFSKVHPDIAAEKPEWLYIGVNGKNLEFNNTVAACINGGYYQEYAFEILKEVITNYDIDGIFFNMMGYTGPAYDGTFHGICQCENCKKRFSEATGLKLPSGNSDPQMIEYRRFQRETSNELYKKVTDFIKQQNPDLVIYNYNDVGTSWIASESGASMRPGPASTNDADGTPLNRIRLKSLGVEPEYEIFPQAQATYLKVSERDKLAFAEEAFDHFTLTMMHSRFLKCKVRENARGYLRLLPSNMYGPSEKTYHTESDITDFPGVIANNYGQGRTVYIPWMLGSEYDAKGNYAHRALFLGSLNNLLEVKKALETDASAVIEMTHLANLNGAFEWVGMINHSGFMGNSVREPVPVHNTTIRLKPIKPVKEVRLLRSDLKVKFRQSGDGWIECVVPQIGDFELMLCLYK